MMADAGCDIERSGEPQSDSPIDWALYYAQNGFRVFPVYEAVRCSDGSFCCACEQSSVCPNAGKHPLTAHGFHDATTDKVEICRWWQQWPNANIGIPTGDGFLVLDVDILKGGDESLAALQRKYDKLPETRQALTGSGGRHYWYRLPDGVKAPCFNGVEDGVDVRADGGYVVVEPSIHKCGNRYRWDGIEGFDEPVAAIPAWLLNLLVARAARNGDGEPWRQIEIAVNRRPELTPELLRFIEEDSELSKLWNLRRNDFTNARTGEPDFSSYDLALASHLLRAGVMPQTVADIITAFRLKHGNPKRKGYRRDYLQRTIRKAREDADHHHHTIEQTLPANGTDARGPGRTIGDERCEAVEEESADKTLHEPRHPYRETGGGIARIKTSKDGSEETIPLTNFTARIASDIGEDDGVEVKRFFGIEARLGKRSYAFIVPATKFAAMEWPIEHIGPKAIVNPNQKDWARAAVQSLSDQVVERRIYVHTGWRRVGDAMLYLHGGGAIGAQGIVADVDVRLSGALAHYSLRVPESPTQLVEAVRRSLQALEVAPDHIAFPALAAAYRACIKSCDFSIWLGGPTGVFKSELAALIQQHYGAAMNARRLPGNFASTGNALEMLAFATKDALLVIDDFAPHGALQDIARYHAAADRILRAAGNNQGRGRLSSDARLRDAKPPRGLILATGEDMPRGQSIRGRTLIVEVAPGDVRTDVLTRSQNDAASGSYCLALGSFVKWMAGRYEEVQSSFQSRVLELRSNATRSHSRTPCIVADLFAGFELFSEFAEQERAITSVERNDLCGRCWAALNHVARAQDAHQAASEPTQRFLELIRAAILSGEAHVAGMAGGAPAGEDQWGWQLVGSGDRQRLVSRGKCVGWLDDDSLYLEPTASFGMAQDVARSTGEQLAIGQTTLYKRLKERGLLLSTDPARQTLKVRRQICGESIPVLHLRADALSASSAAPDRGGNQIDVFEC